MRDVIQIKSSLIIITYLCEHYACSGSIQEQHYVLKKITGTAGLEEIQFDTAGVE